MINTITAVTCSLLLTAALNGAEHNALTVYCIPTRTSIGYALALPLRNSAVAVWYDLTSKTYNGCEVTKPANNQLVTKSIKPTPAQKIYTIAEKQWRLEQQEILKRVQ